MEDKIHDVYWGGHACDLDKGHTEPCQCIKGHGDKPMTLPTGHRHVFGQDVDTAIFDPETTV